ncbi:MAG: hypothetical protein AAFU77_09935 [Myxococcota bacterium]
MTPLLDFDPQHRCCGRSQAGLVLGALTPELRSDSEAPAVPPARPSSNRSGKPLD